jgi:hypothetical protein
MRAFRRRLRPVNIIIGTARASGDLEMELSPELQAHLCQDDVQGVVAETNTHMPTRLTNEIIAAAIDGFEGHKKRIDQQVAELRAMLSGKS